MKKLIEQFKTNQFLFEELIKRDFKKKYKGTILGMAWSVLSPLLMLLIMRLIFTQFFGHSIPHYTTYIFCGNLVFSYFSESTNEGMKTIVSNAAIFSKTNVPKYVFLLSKNVQTFINFIIVFLVFIVFCIIDNVALTWKFLLLIYPIVMLTIFNMGMGMILSALYVFFKDIQYLWSIALKLLMYLSAIFYQISNYPYIAQRLFLVNPIYVYIHYFRNITLLDTIPSVQFHCLCAFYAFAAFGIGCLIYKKKKLEFMYYL